VIALPPLVAGGDHRAVAVSAPPADPDEAVPMTGGPGTVAGVTVFDSTENAPAPTPLTARTWNW
jgi:hypothetical protein